MSVSVHHCQHTNILSDRLLGRQTAMSTSVYHHLTIEESHSLFMFRYSCLVHIIPNRNGAIIKKLASHFGG